MEDPASPTPRKPDGEALRKEGGKWMDRIRAAEKREEDWSKDAEAAEKAYAQDSKSKASGPVYDFNILHSNVETIVPAIYNSTPVPDIRRRFNDPDPEAKSYGDMISRAIGVQIDDNRLDVEIEAGAQDAFCAGRDIVRLRFWAEDQKPERITTEAVSWKDFRWGKAKRWEDVPWVAFRHVVDREELERRGEGDIYAAQVAPQGDKPILEDDDEYSIWEIWCKRERKVKFVREDDGRILSVEDDPLGLTGFYPMPAVVQPITLTGSLIPVCPFTIYRKLADELDTITKRINKIMAGLKVRGLFAGTANSDIKFLSEAGDNEIVISDNLEQWGQVGGLDKAITWWPIEKAVAVLGQLYKQREAVKASIYEITGISDIVRGASNPNETLGAQEIKTQWGALRIQKMQRMIERQVRDIFVIMAELISSKFSHQTLQTMTGIEISEGMAALMQQPILAAYRVNVESDSTVRGDVARNSKQMAEFLQGTATFFSTMAPILAQAPQAAQSIIEIYSAFARNFKLGRQAEDALDALVETAKQVAQQPAPQEDTGQADAAVKAKQVEGQLMIEKDRLEFDRQKHTDEMDLRRKEAGAKALAEGIAPGPDGAPSLGIIALLESIEKMTTAVATMAQASAAPRTINLVKDQMGRPVGAQSVIAPSPPQAPMPLQPAMN